MDPLVLVFLAWPADMLVALMRYPIESFEVDTHFASILGYVGFISLALTFFSNGFCFVLWIAPSAFPTHHLWQSITLGNRHLYHRLFDDLRADQVSRNLWLDHFLPGSPESTPIPAPTVISRASASPDDFRSSFDSRVHLFTSLRRTPAILHVREFHPEYRGSL